jgi:DNA invertase Pin-like site-specific DNA recombinase
MRKQGTRLPADVLEQIKKMINRGGNYAEIARGLGYNRTTVRLAAVEMGLDSGIRRNPITDEHREQIIRLVDEGVSDVDIMEIVGYSRSTISKIRREHGVIRDRNGQPVVEVEEEHKWCPELTGTMRRLICGAWI